MDANIALKHHFEHVNARGKRRWSEDGQLPAYCIATEGDRVKVTNAKGNVLVECSQGMWDMLCTANYVQELSDPWAGK